MSYGYIIVVQDNISDNYSYGIPKEEDTPQTIFRSYEDAKAAIQSVAKKFEEFLPVAYGKAYPYDTVTFDKEINNKSFAPLGWGVINTDNETQHICIGLLRMPLN